MSSKQKPIFIALTAVLAFIYSMSSPLAQTNCSITVGSVNNLTSSCTLSAEVTISSNTTINGGGYTVTAKTGK